MSSANFDSNSTADEVANALSDQIKGKVILITGVSPGSLGSEVVRVIIQHRPKLVILAGRSMQKLNQVREHSLEEISSASLRTLRLDLASLDQVRAAADEVNSYRESIDVLINNAGIMAAPYSQTTDGFESQFGINHLGPFLFTNLIVPKLLAAPHRARIVVVSSDGHAFSPIKFDNPNCSDGKSYNPWRAYGQAKTANVLFAKALAERLQPKGILAYSLHPGVINTKIGDHLGDADFGDMMTIQQELREEARKAGRESTNAHTDLAAKGGDFKWKSLSQGAATHIVAAFDPDIAYQSGEYLQDCQIDTKAREPFAVDSDAAEKLWTLSEDLVGQKFPY